MASYNGPVLVTEGGTKYESWTDGHAVGFKVTLKDGRVRYVYLNPSNEGSDECESPNVFVYTGTEGTPALDTPWDHYNMDWAD